MGHYCRICRLERPNEKFSGKGHKNHICKDCSKLPKVDREKEIHLEEIRGYFYQSNISKKNILRLQLLSKSKVKEVASMAELVHEVGLLHPKKKRRMKFLASTQRELLKKLSAIGLVYLYTIYENIEELDMFDQEEAELNDFYDEENLW